MILGIPLMITMVLQTPAPDPFLVKAELQGIYDEITQATRQFETPADVDDFQAAVYTPTWTFTDASGRRFTWTEMRPHAVDALARTTEEKTDVSSRTLIDKIALTPGGATTTVTSWQERTVVDADGKYGKPGVTHVVDLVTIYRDDWVGGGSSWKLQARQQVGETKTVVDKPLSDK